MDKILITGSTGLLGSALVHHLKEIGNLDNLILLDSSTDLRNRSTVEQIFKSTKPTFVYHLAAKVGGLGANMSGNAVFFDDNIQINTNVLNAAAECQETKKVCSALSTCIYPDKVTIPILENTLHSGEPHKSNFGYAYAKRMLDIYGKALNEKLGYVKFITATPNNMYGENDNFSLLNGHVVPSVIHKIFLAKQNNLTEVEFWGDGTPLRQFSYARDVARDLEFCMAHHKSQETVNVGNYEEYSIKSLVLLVQELMQYKGTIIWNTNKPNGQFKKTASTKLFESTYSEIHGKTPSYHNLNQGLEKTISWFLTNYPNVRGSLK
jgi:GDP-L-fucose synthase